MQLFGMENDKQVIQLQLLATRAFVKAVDHWRAQQLGLSDRSERLVLGQLLGTQSIEPHV